MKGVHHTKISCRRKSLKTGFPASWNLTDGNDKPDIKSGMQGLPVKVILMDREILHCNL